MVASCEWWTAQRIYGAPVAEAYIASRALKCEAIPLNK
jgi:hypothetical protein